MSLPASVKKKLDLAIKAPWREPVEGIRIADYLLIHSLGSSEGARVWRAIDERYARNNEVAIKIFRSEGFPQESRRKAAIRFWKGASALKELDGSRRIVALRAGPDFDNNYLWFSMEYLEDGNLAKLLASPKPPSEQARARIVDDLIEAVAAAHQNSVIHRDIRLENILLRIEGGNPRAVLADFDVAYFDHLLGEMSLTKETLSVRRYMPPEVLRATPDTITALIRRPENDLYALSMVVFDMFAGTGTNLPPDRSLASFKKIIKVKDPMLRSRVSLLCHGGLGKSQLAQRYSSIDDLRARWEGGSLPPRWIEYGVSPFLLAMILVFAILFDWFYVHYRDSFGMRLLTSSAAAALGLTGVAALLKFCVDLVRGHFPKWRTNIISLLTARRWLLLTLAPLAVFAVFGLSALTKLPERVRLISIQRGSQCEILDRAGNRLKVIPGNDEDRLPPEAYTIFCPKDTKPDLTPESLFAPMPSIVTSPALTK